jgi:hypothetical protein
VPPSRLKDAIEVVGHISLIGGWSHALLVGFGRHHRYWGGASSQTAGHLETALSIAFEQGYAVRTLIDYREIQLSIRVQVAGSNRQRQLPHGH